MIGTITWHFQNCVIICNDEDKCTHAMYKEYENLEMLLKEIKALQHRPFVTPDYILVEYHGYVFNVTDEDNMDKFNDFLNHEKLEAANEWLLKELRELYIC
jgi:hypothetical protein